MASVTIFTLTDKAAQLATRLIPVAESMGDVVEHLHKPEDFIHIAQQRFAAGKRCLFVCATGIVMRALGPVLKDKYADPAVLVLDEAGRFVIPLLSGHEGGANDWAAKLAQKLDAQAVITSASDYTQPVYVIGMGCDRGCPVDMLKPLVAQAVLQIKDNVSITALASIELKKDEAGLLTLAQDLDLPFEVFSAMQLREVEEQLSVKSEVVFREVGCYGVAEAAALVAASQITGKPAELVVTKLKNARATVAIARSYMGS